MFFFVPYDVESLGFERGERFFEVFDRTCDVLRCRYYVEGLVLEWGDGFVYVLDTKRYVVDITSVVLGWSRVTDL